MKARIVFSGMAVLGTLVAACALGRRDMREEQRTMEAEVGQPTFFVDFAGFKRSGPETSLLEVYYQVFNFGLQFKQVGSEFVAEYTFTLRISDGDGNQVKSVEQNRKIEAPDYEATQSRFDFRTNQINVELPPGKYELATTLRDLGSNQIFNREFRVTLGDFASGRPQTSDIVFVQAVEPLTDEQSVFNKGDMTIVPSVSRFYGGEDTTRLLYYFEIYSGDDVGENVLVESIVRSLHRGMLYRDTLYVALDQPVTRQLRDINIDNLAPGDYNLEVFLRGRRNKRLDARSESFTVQWTQEALLKHDFNTAIEQLSYIAPGSEIDDMKKLQTMEEKIAAFNAFWASRDPTLGTRENESKREFYRRVTYANRQFRHLRREGWRTDRGRIYIQFGEPDQIDDFPISPQYPPYQIWHYYSEGRYRRFTFLDANEDGDYQLQYPYDGLNMRPDF